MRARLSAAPAGGSRAGPDSDTVDDDERMESVVDITDQLLERVDVALDSVRAATSASAGRESMQPAAATNVTVGARTSACRSAGDYRLRVRTTAKQADLVTTAYSV